MTNEPESNGVDESALQPAYDFVRILWKLLLSAARRWYVVLLTVVLCVGLAIVVGRFSKPQYTSVMLASAAPQQTMGGLGNLSSTLSSERSSISALGLGGLGGSSQFKAYIQLAQSAAVAETIMKEKPEDLALLFGERLDLSTGELKRSAWSPTRLLYSLFGLSLSSKVGVQDVQRAINRMVSISVNADNQDIASISCTSTDPSACPKLLTDMHAATEERLGSISLSDARRLTAYINRILPSVKEQIVRDALVDLLSSATKQVAISELHQAVGAVIISPPYALAQPSFPQPIFLIEAAIVTGIFLGCLLALTLPRVRFGLRLAERLQERKARSPHYRS